MTNNDYMIAKYMRGCGKTQMMLRKLINDLPWYKRFVVKLKIYFKTRKWM